MSPQNERKWESVFLQNLDTIERCIRATARRNRLTPEEQEDFRSYAMERLIQHRFRVFRRFQGRSNMGTYLQAVVSRLRLDFQTEKWGRWRPSARARSLGPMATELEMLIHRNGLSQSEAIETLASSLPTAKLRRDLWKIVAELPFREPRSTREVPLPEDLVCRVGSRGQRDVELRTSILRLSTVLATALQRLKPEDQRIIRMRYLERKRVKEIATTLKQESKPLYRHIANCLRQLRRDLETGGFSKLEILDLLNWEGLKDNLSLEDST